MMLGLKKGIKKQIEATIHEAETGGKIEILTLDEIKTKALKVLHFYQEITKTEALEITPRIILKTTIKRTKTFF